MDKILFISLLVSYFKINEVSTELEHIYSISVIFFFTRKTTIFVHEFKISSKCAMIIWKLLSFRRQSFLILTFWFFRILISVKLSNRSKVTQNKINFVKNFPCCEKLECVIKFFVMTGFRACYSLSVCL